MTVGQWPADGGPARIWGARGGAAVDGSALVARRQGLGPFPLFQVSDGSAAVEIGVVRLLADQLPEEEGGGEPVPRPLRVLGLLFPTAAAAILQLGLRLMGDPDGAVPSWEAVASRCPSGLKITLCTSLVCPRSKTNCLPEAASQTRAVPSWEAVARRVPSGLKLTLVTPSVCPLAVANSVWNSRFR